LFFHAQRFRFYRFLFSSSFCPLFLASRSRTRKSAGAHLCW
jgi:hypothetical protein